MEQQVKDTVLAVYQALQDLNADELTSHFSHSPDLLAFGQRWDSRHKDFDGISAEHKRELETLKAFKIDSKELEVHVRGSVAWTADRPHGVVITGDGRTHESDLRITLVLEQEQPGGPWLIVQWHASRGA